MSSRSRSRVVEPWLSRGAKCYVVAMPPEVTSSSPPPARFNYAEAAKRHFQDASALHMGTPPGVANADHLYGIATECALLGILRSDPTKALLFDGDGSLRDDSKRKHINVLWDRFLREEPGRIGAIQSRVRALCTGSRTRPGERPHAQNPFKGWSVEQRYLSNQAVANEITAAMLNEHRRIAENCCSLLDAALTASHRRGT